MATVSSSVYWRKTLSVTTPPPAFRQPVSPFRGSSNSMVISSVGNMAAMALRAFSENGVHAVANR